MIIILMREREKAEREKCLGVKNEIGEKMSTRLNIRVETRTSLKNLWDKQLYKRKMNTQSGRHG